MTNSDLPPTPIEELADEMGPSAWEFARQTSIGGAGVSTALVLLLTQIGLGGCLLQVSFYAAAVAVPIWLGLWQVGNAYAVRSKAKDHFVQVGAFVGSALFMLAGAATFLSLLTLILAFSLGAGIAFGVVSALMVVFVFFYHLAVQRHRGGA